MTTALGSDVMLSSSEAARRLGITEGTLRVWRTTKRYPLPYVKVGRAVRYRLEDVEAFIERQTVGTSE